MEQVRSEDERRNTSDFRFYAHQFYDGEGRKKERYLAGPVGSSDPDAVASELRERIREQKELVPELRMLGREGFSLADRKTYATIAALGAAESKHPRAWAELAARSG